MGDLDQAKTKRESYLKRLTDAENHLQAALNGSLSLASNELDLLALKLVSPRSVSVRIPHQSP